MLSPRLPIPDSLRGNETGTFAEDSVVRRLPEIAHRAISENDLDPDRLMLVASLADEIATGVVTTVTEPEAPDAAEWKAHVEPHLGTTWIDAPWFFVETYFYRRLLAATGYSQPGPRRSVDPFEQQKSKGLDGATELAARLGETLDDPGVLVAASLWANQVDLSLWPAGEADANARTRAVLAAGRRDRLLVDDTAAVVATLTAAPEVHFVLDNAGAELVADLALAAYVLMIGGRVVVHAKPHPTFVSDTTLADIAATIERLASEDSPAQHIATVLSAAQLDGSLRIETHPFWVSPQPFWECPPDLNANLSDADLVIVKGDANYRRLLGDRHWDPTTPISDIIRPPSPVVALRTSKAEVIAGLNRSTLENARRTDPEWMVNGQWGMVQYVAAET